MAVYYATKAFVLHFSEALSVELHEDNVSVTAHCPGATESEFAKVAGNDKTVLFSKMNHVMSRETVAKHAVDSMLNRKVVSIAGFTNWLVACSVRFTPRWVVQHWQDGSISLDVGSKRWKQQGFYFRCPL